MRRPKDRLIGLLLVSILSFALFSPFAMAAPEEKIGIIILGHGDPTPEWAETIVEMTEQAGLDYPTEVAFLEMVPKYTLEGAIERLEEKGVNTIIVVPLLISTHHSHGREMEYLLGLRGGVSSRIIKPIQTDANIVLTPGMNGNRLIGELLLERALDLSELNESPSGDEIVVFLVHGSELNEDWRAFQEDMDRWCDFVRVNGGFKDVRYGVLTPKFNIPSVMREAKGEGNVIAIPLVLGEGMYSKMLFPMLIGGTKAPLNLGVYSCSGLISPPLSLCLSCMPEGIGDPILMLGMEISDAMMGMMMGGEGDMSGMMEVFSRHLFREHGKQGIQYTTEALVPHPKVVAWIRESVEDAAAGIT